MATALHLLVRGVHVLSMAVLLGGAAFTWAGARVAPRASLGLARQYEWVFWAGLGLLVVTGVGNLGAVGAPGPGTHWGALLTWKLLLVLAFVVASFLRTLLVVRIASLDEGPAVPVATLRRVYVGTAAWLLVVLALAEVLAHG